MRIYTRVMAANVAQEIDARGAFVRGVTGTAVYDLEAVTRTGESLGVMADFQTCLAVEFKNPDGSYKFFDKIRITSATVQTIAVVVHDSFVDDNRLTGIVNITGGIDSKSVLGTIATAPATVSVGVTATVIAAANAKRGTLVAQNFSATADLYIGLTAAVTTANGLWVGPKGSIEISSATGVWGIASAAATDVRVMQSEYA